MTCAACQVTLPVVLSLVERADALAEAAAALRGQFDVTRRSIMYLWVGPRDPEWCHPGDEPPGWLKLRRILSETDDALAAYRAGPPAPYTTDDGRPLCPSCFWKSHAA